MAVVGVLVAVKIAGPGEGLALDALPEGVSAHEVQGVAVFFVRHGRQVEGYLDSAQHLPSEQLWWCPAEGVFVSPSHGELFDAQGRLVAGPASGDLDRIEVKVTSANVAVIEPFTVVQGTARELQDRGVVDAAVWDAYRSWSERTAGEPSTFCQSHIAGEGNPHR